MNSLGRQGMKKYLYMAHYIVGSPNSCEAFVNFTDFQKFSFYKF